MGEGGGKVGSKARGRKEFVTNEETKVGRILVKGD